MQRSGFWLPSEQKVHPILRGRRSADAVVVGGGLSGLTVALWLCKAGLRVTLLEARTLGCGASSRCAGMVSLWGGASYAELERQRGREVAAAYGATQRNAFQALRTFSQEQGDASDWLDTDAFVVAAAERKDAMAREVEAMGRAGMTVSAGKATQSPLPAEEALCLKDMATLNPMQHLRCLAKQGQAQGLSIFEHSRVNALETNLVCTERGSVLAPYIVIATGYPIVNTPGWYFLRLVQRHSWLLPLEKQAPFDGMYADFDGKYALRRSKGGMLFQMNGGLAGENPGKEPFKRFALEYAPYLENAAPHRCFDGLECWPADGLPYIGAYGKKTPNLFVATGYGGRGLLGGMMAAQCISARVLGLPNDGDFIYSGQRRDGAALADAARMGAGMVGRYLKSMARPHAPRCPHMGCRLVYQPKRRVWECPCHGSQFDDIGEVLTAPATGDAVIPRR